MTFGVNVNHIPNGLLSGAYPGIIIDTSKPAIPLVYNVIDNITLVNLLNVMLLPKPKVFVGTMKWSITPVNDSGVFNLKDPVNNYSFSFTDSLPINSVREQYLVMPIIFSGVENFLHAKFSMCLFGYLFEYKF